MSWFYGLVRQNNGKIRVWEIYDEKKYLWGHPAVLSWVIKDIKFFISDMIAQKKYIKRLWTEKELESGNKKISKKWNNAIKKLEKSGVLDKL